MLCVCDDDDVDRWKERVQRRGCDDDDVNRWKERVQRRGEEVTWCITKVVLSRRPNSGTVGSITPLATVLWAVSHP